MLQPVTTLQRDDDMRSVELDHYATSPITPVLASLLINELGNPSLHTSSFDAWYGRVFYRDSQVPFAMRMDPLGRTTIAFPVLAGETMLHALENLLPAVSLELIELPRGMKRAA